MLLIHHFSICYVAHQVIQNTCDMEKVDMLIDNLFSENKEISMFERKNAKK